MLRSLGARLVLAAQSFEGDIDESPVRLGAHFERKITLTPF
jgi:hypothetical protein